MTYVNWHHLTVTGIFIVIDAFHFSIIDTLHTIVINAVIIHSSKCVCTEKWLIKFAALRCRSSVDLATALLLQFGQGQCA